MAASCFFSGGNVALAVVVLVVMLGVAPCYGDCLEKTTECSNILTKLSTDIQGGGDISTLCSAAVQKMTACVDAAKTECSGQQILIDSLQSSLDTLKNSICGSGTGGSTSCRLKSANCAQPIVKAGLGQDPNNITAASVMGLCTNASSMATCQEGLGSECLKDAVVAQMSKSFQLLNTYCGILTNQGQCPSAVECFALSLPSQGQAQPTTCSAITTVSTCLKGKAQGAQCTLDQSKISFTNLLDILPDMCTVANQNCPAAAKCLSSPILPTTPTFGGSGNEPLYQTSDMASPSFFCQLLSKAASCFVENKATCGYDVNTIARIEVKYKDFKDKCPSSAMRGALPGVLIYLMLLLSFLFLSFFPRQ